MPLDLPDYILEHARAPYDPAARKRYYEEHKHLKGRKKGQTPPPSTGGRVRSIRSAPSLHSAANQAASQARVDAIKTKLAALRSHLEQLLKEAGVSDSPSKETSTSSSSTKEKSSTTAQEKADARKASKKYRDKHPTASTSDNKPSNTEKIAQLRERIQKVEADLRAAVQKAREQAAQSGR